jgi:hypothetical protein
MVKDIAKIEFGLGITAKYSGIANWSRKSKNFNFFFQRNIQMVPTVCINAYLCELPLVTDVLQKYGLGFR